MLKSILKWCWWSWCCRKWLCCWILCRTYDNWNLATPFSIFWPQTPREIKKRKNDKGRRSLVTLKLAVRSTNHRNFQAGCWELAASIYAVMVPKMAQQGTPEAINFFYEGQAVNIFVTTTQFCHCSMSAVVEWVWLCSSNFIYRRWNSTLCNFHIMK